MTEFSPTGAPASTADTDPEMAGDPAVVLACVRAVRRDPGNLALRLRAVDALIDLGDLDGAEFLCLPGLDEPVIATRYGGIAERRGDWPEADRRWTNGLERHSSFPWLWFGLAMARERLDDPAGALAAALSGLDCAIDHRPALIERVMMLALAAGEPDVAAELLEAGVAAGWPEATVLHCAALDLDARLDLSPGDAAGNDRRSLDLLLERRGEWNRPHPLQMLVSRRQGAGNVASLARLAEWIAPVEGAGEGWSPELAASFYLIALRQDADPGQDAARMERVLPWLSQQELAFCLAFRPEADPARDLLLSRYADNPDRLLATSSLELANLWLLARAYDEELAGRIGDLLAAGRLPMRRDIPAGMELARIGERIAARRWRVSLRPARPPDAPLKIALCVSGQLRGFAQAAPSWRVFGWWDHDVRVFVSCWRQTGLTAAPARFARSFRGPLRRIVDDLGAEPFAERYPSIPAWFAALHGETSEAAIRDVLPGATVRIEDDRDAPFSGWSNQEKMLYQIGAAHDMAAASGEAFDLEIRIRPDFLAAKRWHAPDWRAVHAGLRGSDVVLGDPFQRFNPVLGPVAHDVFAIGAPDVMADYCGAWRFAHEPGPRFLTLPAGEISAHRTIEEHAFLHGILTRHFVLPFDGYLNEPLPGPGTVRELVLRDMGGAPRDAVDAAVLAAIAGEQEFERA